MKATKKGKKRGKKIAFLHYWITMLLKTERNISKMNIGSGYSSMRMKMISLEKKIIKKKIERKIKIEK